MSHSNDLHAIRDIADDVELRLAKLIGTAAYTKGVRAALELAVLRGWKRRGGEDKPRAEGLPKGVGARAEQTSQRATPVHSPRAVREVNVTTKPISLEAIRRQRRKR